MGIRIEDSSHECPNCHLFLAHGKESSEHRAFCVKKPDPSVRNNCQTPRAPRSEAVTQQDRDDTQSWNIRQIVRETLRDPVQPDAAGTYQHTNKNMRSSTITYNDEPLEQGIKMILGELDHRTKIREMQTSIVGDWSSTYHPTQPPTPLRFNPPVSYPARMKTIVVIHSSADRVENILKRRLKNPHLTHSESIPHWT